MGPPGKKRLREPWLPCQAALARFLWLSRGRGDLKRVVKAFLYPRLEEYKGIFQRGWLVVLVLHWGSRTCLLLAFVMFVRLIFSPLLPGCCIIITLRISVAFKINTSFLFSWIWISWDNSGCGTEFRSTHCFFILKPGLFGAGHAHGK